MANRIQLRRGIKSKLPTTLTEGEPAYTTDTHELFVGTGSGNVNMGGSQWYTGTALSGTGSGYSYSGCPTVKVGDKYLNTSTGYFYECTTAGSGTSAKWAYKGSLKGATGNTGAKGDKGERGAVGTVVIAASNSTAKSKAAADYVCDGIADQSEITSALAALPTGGGKIVFVEGTYNISAAFAISKPVIFEGMGDGTQFNVSDALATCSAAGNIVFRDMKITANTISKYLYKGSGNDDVLLNDVTLTMTATGEHDLQIADTYAAFLVQRSFTAQNCNISLQTKCLDYTNCFAVAENYNYTDLLLVKQVKIIGGYVYLEATKGNAHISRKNLICDAVDIGLASMNATGTASLNALNNTLNGCCISLLEVNGDLSTYGQFGTVVNSTIYAPYPVSRALSGAFIGCCYHDVTLPSNAVLCTKF